MTDTPANDGHRSFHALRLLRLIGVVLLVALVWHVGPRRLGAIAADAHWGWLALGFLLNFPQISLKALRWQRLVSWQGIPFPYVRALLAYFGALLVGFLTPGRIGEMVKAFALRHEAGVGLARALSSVILDRVFDLYLLVVLGVIGFFRFALVGESLPTGTLAMLLAVLPLPLVLLNAGTVRRVGSALAGLPLLTPRKTLLLEKIEDFAAGLTAMRPGRIVSGTLLTFLAYSIFFLQCYCCARAIGFTLPFVDLTLMMAVTNLVGFLPFAPMANIGTREAMLTFFFTTVLDPALPASQAVAWGLSQFLVLFIGGGLIGFGCWQIAPIGLRRAVHEVRAIPRAPR